MTLSLNTPPGVHCQPLKHQRIPLLQLQLKSQPKSQLKSQPNKVLALKLLPPTLVPLLRLCQLPVLCWLVLPLYCCNLLNLFFNIFLEKWLSTFPSIQLPQNRFISINKIFW
ncbi:hypothetical protein NG271_393 [Saccharomyces cerevisiae synthetic construct]|uniref:Putative uncharacterized protein YDR133C n=1 Tax=Saccharomyces cerevisiae (strain ATCC 204508 / S288c) TaxID=559292 RepID=YDR33_YEAST|nr:RecName: Full=Putative uncharacterized protein YDR133C [Saccharomyces cerevisiae S288C]AAS55989.1 YDR133C [Saccharomyces cerevisiae]WNF19950.1 hypothetical protein NG271_393 [Saccharomyces cerevisiae synthetic construct]CAA88214.1 unknown [Saccharomyces cerevisiae]